MCIFLNCYNIENKKEIGKNNGKVFWDDEVWKLVVRFRDNYFEVVEKTIELITFWGGWMKSVL